MHFFVHGILVSVRLGQYTGHNVYLGIGHIGSKFALLSTPAGLQVAEEMKSILVASFLQYADSDLTLTCSLYLMTAQLKHSDKSQSLL